MFSAKELNLEETELREQAALLDEPARAQFGLLELRTRRSPVVYMSLNLLFFLGAQHFYLRRWGRGTVTLLAGLTALGLLASGESLYGGGLLVAMAIIEIPQLLNYELIVHAFNNRSLRLNLQQVRKSLR
jgi:TM2 domain-containing membrane protein YozV